ncbi:MAG: hypothetical protein ACPLKP_01410 [Microgenomates group bacterium]
MNSVFFNLIKVIFFLPFFLFLSTLVFYIPGFLLVKYTFNKLRSDEIIILSYAIGIIIFLLISILFFIIKINPLFLFIILTLFSFIKFKKRLFIPFSFFFKEKFLLFLLLLGTLTEGFINFPSGFPYQNGHLYWSAQGHDGLWHIAVIEAIKKNFPPNNPLYAGEKLFNYHYFSDIVMAGFSNIFPFFNVLDLYFRYFSFLISFLIGLSAYSFLTTWTKNKKIGLWGVFFSYFVGSFGYIVLAIQRRGFFGGETIFWAAQGNTIIGNPPHAFCYVLVPAFFLAFFYYLKQPTIQSFIPLFLLGSFLAGFKVSAGVVLGGALAGVFFFNLLFKKEKKLFPIIIIPILNFFIFKILTRKGESFLIFEPWWFIRTMVVAPDRLNWVDLELKRQFYLAKGGFRSWLRIFQFEATAFLIFLLGNLGTRFVGFWEIFKNFINKKVFKDPLIMNLFVSLIISFLIPLFFVQRGVAYNLIQFMQYFLLIFGFFAAIATYNIIENIKSRFKKIIFVILFVFLSIPTVIGNLYEFYGKNALAIVSNQEIEALNFLKKISKPTDIVLTKPFDRWAHLAYPHQPWPISVWESTAHVSAYTSLQTYLTDEGQVKILGIDPEERLAKSGAFFDSKTPLSQKKSFLDSEKISFIYLRKEENDRINFEIFPKLNLEKIFENQEVVIYKKK